MSTKYPKKPIAAPRRNINQPTSPPPTTDTGRDGDKLGIGKHNQNGNGGLANSNCSGMPPDTQKPHRRSPLSLLKEVCEKLEGNAKFEFVLKSFSDLPVFVCYASITGERFSFNGQGAGFAKPDAKQEASRDILLQVNPEWEPYLIPTIIPIPFNKLKESSAQQLRAADSAKQSRTRDSSEHDELDGSIGAEFDFEFENIDLSVTGNPISDLNVFCQKSGIPTPSYEDIGSRPGEGNSIVFFAECNLNADVKGVGQGTNKKYARRAATNAVIRILRNLGKSGGRLAAVLSPRDGDAKGLKEFKGKDELEANFRIYILGELDDSSKKTTPFAKSAAEFVKSFSTWTGVKTNALKIMPERRLKMCSAFHLLKDINEEQNLRMDLFDFEIESEKPSFRCLAYSSIYPFLNRLGCGKDKAEAREAAAFEVLDFIRNMVRA